MDSRFIQAVKSSIIEMEVCGRVLKPMSMRHRLVLTEIESPIIFTDKPFEPSDIVIAARILSTHDLKEMLANRSRPFVAALFERCSAVMLRLTQLPQPVM